MMDAVARDAFYMCRALRLATKGLRGCAPNPAVGCVIVNDDRIVGEGYHARAGGPHAEVLALRKAGTHARGATAYVTLEPCSHHGRTPPCAPALAEAGVARVVVAVRDPNPQVAGGGLACLREAGILVEEGVCVRTARRINRGFFSRFERGRPWLTLKLAASLDGRSALADGTSQWITGPVARAAVHRGRARAGAVLTGIGTVQTDDPSLTVRLSGQERQPLRVVLDSKLSLSPGAVLFKPGGGTVHVFCDAGANAARHNELVAAGAVIHSVATDADRHPRLDVVLGALAGLEVNDVYAECGPRLSGALLGSDLVDELELFQGPHLLGGNGPPFALLDTQTVIPEPPAWRIVRAQRCGRDARITLKPEKG